VADGAELSFLGVEEMLQAGASISVRAKIDHRTLRERRFAAEQN